jgi:hypothetical protein
MELSGGRRLIVADCVTGRDKKTKRCGRIIKWATHDSRSIKAEIGWGGYCGYRTLRPPDQTSTCPAWLTLQKPLEPGIPGGRV